MPCIVTQPVRQAHKFPDINLAQQYRKLNHGQP
jgi:hypothetical protein